MELSKADRNLLARVGKIVREAAEDLSKAHGGDWAKGTAIQAKRVYDRLCREERDLAALRARLGAGQ